MGDVLLHSVSSPELDFAVAGARMSVYRGHARTLFAWGAVFLAIFGFTLHCGDPLARSEFEPMQPLLFFVSGLALTTTMGCLGLGGLFLVLANRSGSRGLSAEGTGLSPQQRP